MTKSDSVDKKDYGNGSIWYNENKQIWYGAVDAGRDANGRMRRISVTGKTKEEAEHKLEVAKYEKAFFFFVDKDNVTLREMFIASFNEKVREKKMKEYQRHEKINLLSRYGDLLDMRAAEITADDLQIFFQSKLYYSKTSLGDMYCEMKKILDKCVALEIIDKNPINDVPRPATKAKAKKFRALTIDEQKDFTRLAVKYKPGYWEVMLILLYSGMSSGEALALYAEDVHLEEGYIDVNKHLVGSGLRREMEIYPEYYERRRTVLISSIIRPLLVQLLQNHTRKPNSLIFRNRDRRSIDSSSVNESFKRFLDKYDILDPTEIGLVSITSLKKTFAARCNEAGVQQKVVQKQISVSTNYTMRKEYTSMTIEEKHDGLNVVSEYLKSVGL